MTNFKIGLCLVAFFIGASKCFDFIHHDSNAVIKLFTEIHDRCPDITRVYSVGDSVEGRSLTVIEFSTEPGKHEICK